MAWLTGWTKRKSKMVNGSTTLQTNYQMQLTVHKGSGTDTATDIYLGTNVRDDFGDVRFTKSDGSSLLNYWIESYTSGSVATIWIQIDSIPTTGTTIYVYYDNSSQITTSNGSSTFDFFDNFESYSIGNLNGQGGWSGVSYYQVSSANPYSGNKSIYATSNDGISAAPDMYNTIPSNKNFIVTWYAYYSSGISVGIGGLWPYEGATRITQAYNDNSGQLYDNVGALGYTMSTGRWYKFQLTVHDDNTHDIKVFDGSTQVVNVSGRSNLANMTAGVDRLYLYHDFRFNTGYMDDLLVRKYISPEPTFGASGTEEIEVALWLSGWNRRKLKIINGSTSSQANYQIKLTVHKATGTDGLPNAYDVYLGTNVRDDFGDVRFTMSNGSTHLNYWIESYISGVSADIWIQIDYIPVSPSTRSIYIYYDNSSATTTSNGNTTFDLFDDFLGTSLDLTKWQGNVGYASLSGGIMTFIPTGDSKIISIQTFGSGHSIRIRNNIQTPSWSAVGFQVEPYVSPYQVVNLYKDSSNNSVVTRDTTENIVSTNWSAFGSYSTKEIQWAPGIARWYEDNVEKTNSPTTIQIPSIPLVAMPARGMYSVAHYVDWVFVRKYSSPEPTLGSSGVEEILAAALITATDMIITTSQTPCLQGICTVTATVTWTNQGTATGSFVPSLTIDGTPIVSPYSSENLDPGVSAVHSFDITNLATGDRTICPSPN